MKKLSTSISYLILMATLTSVMTGCFKRAPTKPVPLVKTSFGLNLKDTVLDLTIEPSAINPSSDKGVVKISTSEWLGLANEFMKSDSDKLRGQGVAMSREFYALRDSTTKMTAIMDPPSNSFGEMVYQYAGDALAKVYFKIFDTAKLKVVESAKSAGDEWSRKTKPPVDPSKRLEATINDVIDLLISFEGYLVKGLDPKNDADVLKVLKSISDGINAQIITAAQKLLETMANEDHLTGEQFINSVGQII